MSSESQPLSPALPFAKIFPCFDFPLSAKKKEEEMSNENKSPLEIYRLPNALVDFSQLHTSTTPSSQEQTKQIKVVTNLKHPPKGDLSYQKNGDWSCVNERIENTLKDVLPEGPDKTILVRSLEHIAKADPTRYNELDDEGTAYLEAGQRKRESARAGHKEENVNPTWEDDVVDFGKNLHSREQLKKDPNTGKIIWYPNPKNDERKKK